MRLGQGKVACSVKRSSIIEESERPRGFRSFAASKEQYCSRRATELHVR